MPDEPHSYVDPEPLFGLDGSDPHDVLLAAAGRAPDSWLAVAREVLAEGDFDRLAELLAALEPVLDANEPVRHDFTAEVDDTSSDVLDGAVVVSVRARNDVTACWATMRDGVDRVYLVQADEGADLPTITVAVQRAVEAHDVARVEVFGPETELRSYHESALRSAVLIWSREPLDEVRIARTFDGASTADGPWFGSAHELVIDPVERQRLLDFLGRGKVVFETDLRMTDLISASAGAVPTTLRTDGTWVWSEATRYYLERHMLAPDPRLAEYALLDKPNRTVTPLDRYRVLAALNPENEEGPLWQPE